MMMQEIIEKPIFISRRTREPLSNIYDVIISSNSNKIFIWKKAS